MYNRGVSTADIDTVYVQKAGGEFINETAYSMWNGCRLLGVHVEPFEEKNFEHVTLTKQTLVHGYVRTVKNALKSLGIDEPVPRVDGAPPPELLPYYGRNIWTSTMGEIRQRWAEDKHLFIKPLYAHKAFTGHVTSGAISDLIQTASFPDDFEVLCSEPVEFIVEYRLFVHNGIIVDCRRYRGDYRRLVDIDTTALACVQAYKGAPVAYSLDLGLTDDGRTLVVEVNDAFALGGYGMPAIPYAQMVIDRWVQMVNP